jgi:PIN domain nuclease of toxin-antitoxin system
LTYLLDTHVLLFWLLAEKKLSPRQRRVLRSATPDNPLLVSDITLWEIATLYDLGRIELDLPLRDWLLQATAPPLVETVRVTVPVAAEVAALPPSFHRDPADRIIVATCRVLGATLLSRDRLIVNSRLVPTVS